MRKLPWGEAPPCTVRSRMAEAMHGTEHCCQENPDKVASQHKLTLRMTGTGVRMFACWRTLVHGACNTWCWAESLTCWGKCRIQIA